MTGSQRLSFRVINDVRVSGVVVNIIFNDILRSVCPCYVERETMVKATVCVKALLEGNCCINNIIITLNFYKWGFIVVVILWAETELHFPLLFKRVIWLTTTVFTEVTLGNIVRQSQSSAHGNSNGIFLEVWHPETCFFHVVRKLMCFFFIN